VRGAALVSALLTVALATIIAAQLIAGQGEAIERLGDRRDRVQATWLARGAADWARAILSEDARTSRIDYLAESWAIKVPPFPIEGAESGTAAGEIAGEIVDLNGCFDLNRLAVDGKINPVAVATFSRLLQRFGTPQEEAVRVGQRIGEWIDQDKLNGNGEAEFGASAIADNRPLIGLGTLGRIPGVSSMSLAKLAGNLCVLPQRSPLNINTVSAAVLESELSDLNDGAIERIIEERNRVPFRDLADFNARFPEVRMTGKGSDLAVSSEYFLITTRARYGVARSQLTTLVRRTGSDWPEIIWQQTL